LLTEGSSELELIWTQGKEHGADRSFGYRAAHS
jgi:hypothetical protein